MNAKPDPMTDTGPRWSPDHVSGIARQQHADLPVIRPTDVVPMLKGHVVWDMWPIAREDGSTVFDGGRSFWFFLTAPRLEDPDARHDMARIRLFSRGADGWRDHGETFADGFTPGSREWSGSAVLAPDGETLTMYFTAAGRAGRSRTFEQRLFETTGRFRMVDGRPEIEEWSRPVESLAADGEFYAPADQETPRFGMIKGFRDPGYFRDPADGAEYLLFTGSAAWTEARYDGVIGLAKRGAAGWMSRPPILTAIGVNAELERPHVVVHADRYYLFWSTQRARFAPDGPTGPNGLYAMVADGLTGPWRPANGTGLVAANPQAEPFQAYCWWVTPELEVISFVDLWGLEGRDPSGDPQLKSDHFGGTVAPCFRLRIDGDAVVPEIARPGL